MASITDSNFLVWNQGKNPLVNFNFMLRVELLFDLPCKSVKAFTRELEYDFIQEGGLNDYVHMRRKPISRPFTLEVERYVGVDYIDPMKLGTEMILPLLLFVGRNHDQFIPGIVARTYVFTGCSVMKKTYGDLVGDQSGLLVETTTIGYREMLCVDIPWSEVGDNIPAGTPELQINAASEDKTAAELKAMGQDYYMKAQEASVQAAEEYSADEMATLTTDLDTLIKNLRAALEGNGALVTALNAAKTGMESGGRPLKDIAAESAAKVRPAEEVVQEKEAALREKQKELAAAQQDENAAARAAETAARETAAVQNQHTRLTQRIASLEEEQKTASAQVETVKRRAAATQAEVDRLGEADPVDADALAAAKRRLEAENDAVNDARDRETDLKAESAELKSQATALKAQADEKETAQKTAEAALTEAAKKTAEAQSALTEPATALETVRTAYEVAEAKAQTDGERAKQAEAALGKAQSEYDTAMKNLGPLQNNLTNLPRRKESAEKAQTDCAAAIATCKEKNDSLQALPDDPIMPVNMAYHLVRQSAKETLFQERVVRDAKQYMLSARELMGKMPAVPATPAAPATPAT